MSNLWTTPRLTEPHRVVITYRMADMLAGICAGRSNAEIADWFELSEDTVKTHVRRLFAAMGARNRAHAAALAASGQVALHIRGHEYGKEEAA